MPEENNIRDITFSWEEGRYFDLWMIAHTVGGALVGALVLYYLPLPRLWAYSFATALFVGWEVIEIWFDIRETIENRILDVITGLIGFTIVFELGMRLEPQAQFVLLIYSAVMAGTLDLLGWLDHRRRANEALE